MIQPDREPTRKNTSTSGGCSSLILFIICPGGNPPPPHWSRVLHHNNGPNQYKSCVFLCCEFVEFVREILASKGVDRWEGKTSCPPQCLNLKGLPEPHIQHLARQVGVCRSFPSISSSLCRSVVSMADARRARAERRIALTARVAQMAPVGGPHRPRPVGLDGARATWSAGLRSS